jgi:hypothetical protein
MVEVTPGPVAVSVLPKAAEVSPEVSTRNGSAPKTKKSVPSGTTPLTIGESSVIELSVAVSAEKVPSALMVSVCSVPLAVGTKAVLPVTNTLATVSVFSVLARMLSPLAGVAVVRLGPRPRG